MKIQIVRYISLCSGSFEGPPSKCLELQPRRHGVMCRKVWIFSKPRWELQTSVEV